MGLGHSACIIGVVKGAEFVEGRCQNSSKRGLKIEGLVGFRVVLEGVDVSIIL